MIQLAFSYLWFDIVAIKADSDHNELQNCTRSKTDVQLSMCGYGIRVWVRHSQGEPLYTVSEHFINPTSVSANHYFLHSKELVYLHKELV